MSAMNVLSLVALSLLSLLSLSFCTPVPDNPRFNPRYSSDGPRTRRTYSPIRHSRDKYTTLRQFSTSTHSPISHFLPSSPSAAHVNQSQTIHHSSIHPQNRDSTPSFLSAITSSLARLFNFHQQTTQEPTLEPTPETTPELTLKHSLATEAPADSETDTQRTRQHQYSSPPIHTPPDTQHHLERAKRLVEDALSQVDTSSNEDLSPQELFQMVHLWTRMFQAIERALTHYETANTLTPSTTTENETNEQPSLDAPATQTDNIEEMRRNSLPDVKTALAQAEQLNKLREAERQHKLAQIESEQLNDLDYTEGLPKSAPSYPTRLRLQMEAQREQWPRLR